MNRKPYKYYKVSKVEKGGGQMVCAMRTVKIPEYEFERVKKARQLLAMNGINSLTIETQKAIQNKIKDFDKMTMGIIIGIGATLLIQELSK